jgi:hypothetical protein
MNTVGENASTSPFTKALAVTGISLLLGLLFNYFFWEQLPGLAFPVFVAAIIAGLVALAAGLNRPIKSQVLWLFVPLGFFSGMVAFRASPPLLLLNLLATLALLLLVARLTNGGRLTRFNLIDYLKIPFLPFKFFAPLGRTMSDMVGLGQFYKSRPLTAQILKGVVIAIPVLIVFGLLFGSADLIFQKYLTKLFDIHINEVTVARTLIVLLVAAAFTGAYAFIFGAESKPATEPTGSKPAVGQVESSIVLGSVGVLFFLFILIQLAYLFGGASNISAQGFTYAEYARKGFFELIAVAVITGGLLWAADKTVAKTAGRHTASFRILSGLLIAEVILIMASAFKRLYLYEQAYGFTTLRLYSHVFVIFLAVVFALLLVKILRDQPEHRFIFPVFITAIIFLAGLNLLNPDAFIARQNLDRYHQTGKLDGAYLGRLSADARPEVEKALSATTGQTHTDIEAALQAHDRSLSGDTDWQSWNYARRHISE